MMAVSPFGPASGRYEPDEANKVAAVIARSKTSKTTYAVYFWNRIQHPGQSATEEWSAEFNLGNLHRVETPRDRIVADCSAQTGTYLSLPSGKLVTGPEVAAVACGINTNRHFLEMRSLGRVKTRFGDADRVRVADSENIRTYDISKEGIILRTLYQQNDSGHATALEVETVGLSHTLPATAMFDQASLARSFVSQQFRRNPNAPP
jgi:hypothetical protein